MEECLVIETNILEKDGAMVDHQSRVIDVKNWNDFIKEIKSAKCVVRHSYLGRLLGNTIPENAKVSWTMFDDFHGSCTVETYNGRITKKLFYRVK